MNAMTTIAAWHLAHVKRAHLQYTRKQPGPAKPPRPDSLAPSGRVVRRLTHTRETHNFGWVSREVVNKPGLYT
jgi:hypothetical protein